MNVSPGKKAQGSSLCNLLSAVRSRGVGRTRPHVHVVLLGSLLPTHSKSIGFGKASALVEQPDPHHEGDYLIALYKDTGFLSSMFGLFFFQLEMLGQSTL